MPRKGDSAASAGLRDAILAGATKARHGKPPWWCSLPSDVMDELRQIRDEHHAGRIHVSRWRLSASIAARLAERGFSGCTQLVVDRWLALRD